MFTIREAKVSDMRLEIANLIRHYKHLRHDFNKLMNERKDHNGFKHASADPYENSKQSTLMKELKNVNDQISEVQVMVYEI